MEKFLSIPVTGEQGNQLLSATGIVLIEQLSTTTVGVYYKSGSTGTDVVTITHAAPVDNETMRDAIQDAIIAALQTPWTYVAYPVSNLPFAVGGIAIA
jgi:hypothetical protein